MRSMSAAALYAAVTGMLWTLFAGEVWKDGKGQTWLNEHWLAPRWAIIQSAHGTVGHIDDIGRKGKQSTLKQC